jgi:hypothetical protein
VGNLPTLKPREVVALLEDEGDAFPGSPAGVLSALPASLREGACMRQTSVERSGRSQLTASVDGPLRRRGARTPAWQACVTMPGSPWI